MRCLAIAAALAVHAVSAQAASTQTWELSQYAELLAGTFDNVALTSDGSLQAAPALETLIETEEAVVWSLARTEDGTVYCGTGHRGAVFRLSADGTGQKLWEAPEIEVFALTVGPDGQIYAGTSPDGKVYKVSPDGEAEEFFDPEQKYIWALLFDTEGRLVVGTGDGGIVYRVQPDGTAETWFESGQRHVMSLALDREGRVLAGTDPDGILYRLEDDGTAFGLYDSDMPEVRSIAVAANGAIYFAAMGGGMERILKAVPVTSAGAAGGGAVVVSAGTASVTSSVQYSQGQAAYSGERAALMRMRPGLAVDKLWSSNEENMLGLSLTGSSEPRLMVATDREGRIYRIGPDRERSLLSQTGKAQMTALLQVPEGVLVASAHGGTIYKLADAPAETGTYETAPRNTEGVSQWGHLSWRGDVPDGGTLSVRTRSGNTYRPDTSWSAWSEPLTAADGSQVESPPARFLQWQATIGGGSRLDAVQVRYLPQNSAPVVNSFNVVPEAPTTQESSNASSSNSNSYSITVSASGNSSAPRSTSKSTPTVVRKLALVWGSEDADGDTLRAEIAFRGEGETTWKTIEDGLAGPRFSIESDALADGLYEFRVRVDDGASNSPERTLSAERLSRPVLVDHTPPALTALQDDGDGAVRFEAQDAASPISSAEYSVNAGDWRPVLSDDGILDARSESFTINLGPRASGEHLIVLRVRDARGNAALARTLRP